MPLGNKELFQFLILRLVPKMGTGVEEAFQAIAKAAMLKAMSEGEQDGEAFFDERYEVITDVDDNGQGKTQMLLNFNIALPIKLRSEANVERP
eukprot:gnl/Chilomastix_caulleri/3853.p1 GENE.gnl/Chilomastix_caulleri/3853~~gnl/Chilomastix_caulleri/3853.p1  ORF type:complete len:93 (+),score=21.30 gnl/Chilomastix_caulleri/3853:421-699(+)